MLLTVDSSVLVAALRGQEPSHEACQRLLEQISEAQHIAVQPYTVLIEVVAAIRRRTGSEELAARVYQNMEAISSLRFVELDARRAEDAVVIAEQSGLRGMDAIVVQVAREFGSSLVTLDDEMQERVGDLVAAQPVTEF